MPKRKKEGVAEVFLEELASNGGFIGIAARTVGISRDTAYQWKYNDPEFARKWDLAMANAAEELEKECRRRAYEGYLEPVFYQGKKVGTVRRFSDTLLIFQTKALLPDKYRDQIKVITETDADKAIDSAVEQHKLPVPDADWSN